MFGKIIFKIPYGFCDASAVYDAIANEINSKCARSMIKMLEANRVLQDLNISSLLFRSQVIFCLCILLL